MAGIFVAEATLLLGKIAELVQAFCQAKQVLFDPLRVRPDNVGEIHDDLNNALQTLDSLRMDLEKEVEENKQRVPSRTYEEWKRRVMEIDAQVRDLTARYSNQSNEQTWFCFFSPRLDFSAEMKKLRGKVINLWEERHEIKDKMLVDHAPERVIEMNARDIRKFETLRAPLEKILDRWKRYKDKGIGIYGPVGIGKTTVMLNLNNHYQVAKMFDIVIWLTVSTEGSKGNLKREHLIRAIAQRLKLTMAGTSNADEVAQRILTELKGKKYLLLLDDVKEYLNLEEIGIPSSNNGSKIVLTTGRHDVSYKMVEMSIKVAYLSSKEAWCMFEDILGSNGGHKIGPLARRVCRECNGLPLLIEKIANTFKLKNTESLWRDGLNSWRKWPSQECKSIKGIYESLRFCYDDMGDDRYKECFLYGALYPEGSDINIDSLWECWAAEDLLGDVNKPREDPVMTAELILSHLKDVSLLEKGNSDYHVTIHKSIRKLALNILEDNPQCNHLVETNKELTEPPDEKSWRKKRRISLGDNHLNELPNSPNCSMLSTLFLQKNLGLEVIPPAFFKHMKKLRVLDLSHTGITLLPSSLSILSSLQVLYLNNCKQLVDLPSHIVKLVSLESLDIHGSGITYIPPDIQELMLLKRLWVSFGNGNDTQNVSFNYNMISKLSRLEELVICVESCEQLTNEVVENLIKEVACLQNFKKLKVCFSNSIVDVIEIAPLTVRILAPEAGILLTYVRRRWWEVVKKIGSFRFFIGSESWEYNHNPDFDEYTKYVMYCNGVGSNTPILEVLAEAEGFELVNHQDIKQLSDFGIANMNKIQGCLVEGCDAMETIMDTVGSELLPNLEQLFVKNLPMLKSIWKEGPLQPGTLTKLTKLVLSGCRILVEVFPPGAIQLLHGIEHLNIEKCNEVKDVIPEADVGNLPVLPKLKELILLDMEKLSSICAVESLKWPSLEKLKIFGCPGLHKLPFNKGDVANLERIEADEQWWGALQWQNQEDKEGLQKLCIFW